MSNPSIKSNQPWYLACFPSVCVASLFQIAGLFYACSGTPRCEISQRPMLVVSECGVEEVCACVCLRECVR